jgi:nanoRNase/pAp phosphatase (c-di-AMP/oligoRNAs hydrolase)
MLDIEYLQKIDQIYVIGHQNLDADSIFSSYLLSNILKYMGVNSNFAILDENYQFVADEKELILDYFTIQPIVLKKNETHNYNYVLVDHNSKLSSIVKGNVVGCVDHHSTKEVLPNNYFIGQYASTTAYIYDMYKDIYPFSEYEKTLISLAIIMDTKFLRTKRFKEIDAIILKELDSKLDIDYLRQKYFRVNDFSLSVEINFNLKKKLYERNNVAIYTTYIDAYKEHHLLLEDYVEYLKQLKEDAILTWYEYDTSKTFCYIKINDKIKYLEYDFIASRANDIIKDAFT